MALVKFARGPIAAYKPTSDHKDYVFFCTDQKAIYVGGTRYGFGDLSIDKLVSSVEEVSGKAQLLVTYSDGTTTTIDLNKVAAGEKVISVDTNGYLKSTLSLSYVKEDNKIYLLGIDQDKANAIASVDTSDFTKDSFLKSAEVVTSDASGNAGTFLKLTWSTANYGTDSTTESTEVTYVNVAHLVDQYITETEDATISIESTGNTDSTTGAATKVVKISDTYRNKINAAATQTSLDETNDNLADEVTRATEAEQALEDKLDAKVMDATGYTTEVEIGGMAKGTDITGKTAEEVLDLILKPEYVPVFTDATATISCTSANNGDVFEVGTATPLEAAYSSAGNKAKTASGSSDSNLKYGGEASESFSVSSATAGTGLTYGTATTKPGVFKVKATRVYAAGTDVVVTNKGTATNLTASNYTTISANASANSNIDAETHTIKSITKTAELTINYAYKVYASTTTAGELTSLGLKTSVSGVEATLKGGAAGQKFAVPSTYTGVKIEEYNATLKSWTDTTSGWTVSTTSYTLADGTTGKTYNVYTRNGVSGEDMKARITATVGA